MSVNKRRQVPAAGGQKRETTQLLEPGEVASPSSVGKTGTDARPCRQGVLPP